MIRIIEIVGMANVIVGAALSYLFLGPLMWNQAAGYGFIFSAVITSGIMFFIILRHQKERSETAVIEKDMTKKIESDVIEEERGIEESPYFKRFTTSSYKPHAKKIASLGAIDPNKAIYIVLFHIITYFLIGLALIVLQL